MTGRAHIADAPKDVTYLGVPARIWSIRVPGGKTRRVNVVKWLEDSPRNGTVKGDLQLTDMEGDGRRAAGTPGGPTIHARAVIADGTAQDADDWAASQLQYVGGCPCECNTGGFCGGCGHAGCGRRL